MKEDYVNVGGERKGAHLRWLSLGRCQVALVSDPTGLLPLVLSLP